MNVVKLIETILINPCTKWVKLLKKQSVVCSFFLVILPTW